jgi:hypothetical protein
MAYGEDKQKAAAKQETNDILNSLFKEYGLGQADVYKHKHFNLITRSGMEKVIAKSGIVYDMELVSGDSNHAIMKGVFTNPHNGAVASTFASANQSSSTSAYYAEMAEKRCVSRGVLKLLGLYALGVFGDDEWDTKTMSAGDAVAFKESRRSIYTKTSSDASTSRSQAVYKGA